MRTRLDTIIEESECSKSSSQVSVSKKRGKKEALSFSNKSALEDLENEPERALLDEPGGTNSVFANKYALDLERGKAMEADIAEDSEGLTERGTAITTSFRNVVAMRSMNGSSANKKDNLQSNDSPLMKYSPRGVTTPPGEVKGKLKLHATTVEIITWSNY